MKTKKISELKPGDIFTYSGAKRIVIKIEEGEIKHRNYPVTGGHTDSIGVKCQAKVEYHGKSNQQNVQRFSGQ